ncbi:MAG: glycosyltransferase family 9 protein [Fimbriimonadaceae bacterium]|nr:glycosyltransferase family 9 protein [Fimbriimonadaceae bacterium]
MRVLIARLSAMGDVIHSLPVAAALKRMDPEAEVVWVCSRRWAPLVRLCRWVDRVEEATGHPLRDRALARSLGRFDIGLDLQGLFRSGWIIGQADCKERLGFHWQRELAGLFTTPIRPDPTSLHVVDRLLDVARAAGAPDGPADFGLMPSPEDLARMDELLAGAGVQGPFVAVNPSSAQAAKRWPPAAMAACCRRVRDAGFQTVFVGAPSDRRAMEEVVNAGLGSHVDLIGRTSPAELVALISRAVGQLSGDTGSAHIAAALGLPSYSVFVATRPERNCPYSQIHRCRIQDPDALADLMIRELARPDPAGIR